MGPAHYDDSIISHVYCIVNYQLRQQDDDSTGLLKNALEGLSRTDHAPATVSVRGIRLPNMGKGRQRDAAPYAHRRAIAPFA